MKLQPPNMPRLDDDAEVCRKETERKLVELQQLPFADVSIVRDVTLASGVDTLVAHKLGRAPVFVQVSPPRGSASVGCVVESRDNVDRTKFVKLTAVGFVSTVIVDLVVL